MNPAVSVENISKQYKIGLREKSSHNFGEALVNALSAPLRALKTLGEKSTGEDLFWALRNVSFNVARGEVVGIIGRNGAGKSTLLKVLSRITEPTEGRALVRGRVASLLEVGTGFHQELTGRENIFLNGAILGMKKREIIRKFDEIVAFADIERFLDTPVKRYSSGMWVRLGFAVAAHLEPEILVVDEVLAVGDAQFQRKCLGKMHKVAGEGRTVLFVSHNMHSVRQLCSRAILLGEGRVIMDGLVGDVIDKYMEDSLAVEGQVSLDEWNGIRESPGDIRVVAVRTLNQRGEISSMFEIFEPITFEADIAQVPDNGFVMTFNVYDKDRVLAYSVRSQDSRIETKNVGSDATVRMTIPQLRLTDGAYSVMIWLGNHLDQLQDLVDDVLVFHVINKGHSVERLQSVIHETGQWELVRSNNGPPRQQ